MSNITTTTDLHYEALLKAIEEQTQGWAPEMKLVYSLNIWTGYATEIYRRCLDAERKLAALRAANETEQQLGDAMFLTITPASDPDISSVQLDGKHIGRIEPSDEGGGGAPC